MMQTPRRNLTCFLTNYGISCSRALRRFCSLEEGESAPSSPAILDLLLHKHQFSPEVASKVTSVLNGLKDPQKSVSTLSFLKASGFSDAQLLKMANFSRRKYVLSTSLENGIKPRIRVFKGFGLSSDDIAAIISKEPCILRRNLDSCVIPNIEFLKSWGVPMERILRLLCKYPRGLLSAPEMFREIAKKAEELGADRSSNMFIYAIKVVSSQSCETLELKLQAFRNCEFSDVDITKMFGNSPQVLGLSVEKIKRVRDIILATKKYSISCIAKCPTSLYCSIEERYIPRFQVLEILERKNLIKKWPKLSTVSRATDEKFFNQFVCPNLSEVGDVFCVHYKGQQVQQGRTQKIT